MEVWVDATSSAFGPPQRPQRASAADIKDCTMWLRCCNWPRCLHSSCLQCIYCCLHLGPKGSFWRYTCFLISLSKSMLCCCVLQVDCSTAQSQPRLQPKQCRLQPRGPRLEQSMRHVAHPKAICPNLRHPALQPVRTGRPLGPVALVWHQIACSSGTALCTMRLELLLPSKASSDWMH